MNAIFRAVACIAVATLFATLAIDVFEIGDMPAAQRITGTSLMMLAGAVASRAA